MKLKYFLSLGIVLLLASCKLNGQPGKEKVHKPYVIMLSMDGFRWDYPEKANTPNLDNIEKTGVRAQASIPCFPTKTFPNHYSMATGLYPDNHGIIFNRFYAPDLDSFYAIGNSEAVTDSSFYLGEPIWVTAEKQGVKSASYFWVGSEASHNGFYPSYYYNYDGKVPYEKRIEGVLEWIMLPEEKRPHLIMWYLEEPDSKGHDVGPDHPEMVNTIEYLDSIVGVFYKKISDLPFTDQINVIITSDHGMGAINSERTHYIYDIIKKEWCKYIDGADPVYSIEANEGFYDSIYYHFTQTEHVKIWKKSEIPPRLNFGNSPRIKDFVVVADSSWSLSKRKHKNEYSGGTHGFDNRNTDMHAIFYAYGPAFKKGYKHHAINNIDLYPLICEILGLKPAPVDGKLENTMEMLK